MASSRHYPIAAAAEQLCVLQAAAAAMQIACACVRIKRVRVRVVCSKAFRYIRSTSDICLRAVTVLAKTSVVNTNVVNTYSYATTEGYIIRCRPWRLAYDSLVYIC